MSNLLRKPRSEFGKIHDLNASTANGPHLENWNYVGFTLYKLKLGETVSDETNEYECILVMIEGKAEINAAGQNWGILGDRMDVFEKKPPHSLYIPNGQKWSLNAKTDCVIAVCSAPGKSGHPARKIEPNGIKLIKRGSGSNTRYIHNIAMEDEDYCDSLLVTEVFTPDGNWSSYPSHRHDEDDFPNITYLEETYYHRINPKNGFGIQRIYHEDGSINEMIAVSDGDLVLVPKGHHPCGVPYGFEMYYLNVMAGPLRKWRFKTEPNVQWIVDRDSK